MARPARAELLRVWALSFYKIVQPLMASSDTPIEPGLQTNPGHECWEAPVVLSLGESYSICPESTVFLYHHLDGGGVRGLSSLLILKHLFMEVARIDTDERVRHDRSHDGNLIARPCYYLDHMVGSSTGGYALMRTNKLARWLTSLQADRTPALTIA